MKNTYLTSHFPLIAISLFSLSFSIYTSNVVIQYFNDIGLYHGMIEFFSERGIQLTILFLLWLFFFMLFSAFKLIADTINELSLLFFSKDEEGKDLQALRGGSWIFLIGSIASLTAVMNIKFLVSIFLIVCLIYFIFFVYKVSTSLSIYSLFGLIIFQLFFWAAFISVIIFAILKIYNSIVASLP